MGRSPPPGYGRRKTNLMLDFRHVISETLQNDQSQSIQKMSLVFSEKPPCFTLSAFEVVYPTFHTSHRIGKVF